MDVTLRLTLNQDHVYRFIYKSFDVVTGISTPIDISAYTATFAAMSGKIVDVAVGGVGVSQDSVNGIVNVVIPAAVVADFRLNNIRFFQVRLAGSSSIVMASGRIQVTI